jgi:uncharacterized protein (TIGR02996 family)
VDPADGVSAAGAVLSVDELWRRCVEQPDDDEVRGVLADLLQTSDDPRGELFTLQLLPADPDSAPARRARIRELVTRHGPTWLGPLYEIASGASFERGLVSRLELAPSPWYGHDPRWVLDDRELWSVEELVAVHTAVETLRHVLASPHARSLRRLGAADGEMLDAIAACPAPISHLACVHPGDASLEQFVRRMFEVVAARDSIVSLAVWSRSFEELRRQRWFARLTSITVACSMLRGLALWRELPASMSLVLTPTPALDSCALAFPADCRLELRRDGVARVSGEWLLQSLDVLDALPREIVRIELEDTSEPIVERIRAAVGGTREIALRGLVGRAGNLRWS